MAKKQKSPNDQRSDSRNPNDPVADNYFRSVERQLNQRFRNMSHDNDQRFERLDRRFERLDQRFAKFDQRFRRLQERMTVSKNQIASRRLSLLSASASRVSTTLS